MQIRQVTGCVDWSKLPIYEILIDKLLLYLKISLICLTRMLMMSSMKRLTMIIFSHLMKKPKLRLRALNSQL